MSADTGKRRLVILDRDGVINQDSSEFVKNADEWIPLHGSIQAIADLCRAGFTVAVASNQSGLARGLFDPNALDAMHSKMNTLVASAGGHIDRIVVCPHAPDEGCRCRKPSPGMIEDLLQDYGVDAESVPVVGDSLRDLEAAAAVDARPILVRTGNGQKTEQQLTGELSATPVYDDLAAAVDALLDTRS